MRRTLLSAAAAAIAILTSTSASACPLCQSDTGQRVREGIFDNEFGGTLLAMVLPFLVISLVVGMIHGGPPQRSSLPPNVRDDRSPTSVGDEADGAL